MDVASLCRALRDEPLFHASLGSKELFHSNLLAWMVERFPDRASEVLGGWLIPGPGTTATRVRREFAHLDLVVEFPGHEALIVENKTFALPDETQLARYTAEAVPRVPGSPTMMLLSLIDPGWPDEVRAVAGRNWRRVSYRQFGERLAAAFGDDGDFAGQVLAHEARLLLLLDELFDMVGVRHENEPFALPTPIRGSLVEAGLAEAVDKARIHQVKRLVADRLRAAGVPDPERPIEAGLTNGQALLSAYWRKSADVAVGWQFQGRQWRLAMVLTGEGLQGRGRHPQRARFAAEHADYFDFGRLYDLLGCTEPECLPKRGKTDASTFNRFDPAFVYRYRLVPDRPVAAIVGLAVAYSRWAAEWALP